jgi:site-specific recombinase XerD
LALAGVDPRTIQELGGWKEIKMVERYAHLSQKHKADALEKLLSQLAENSTTVLTTSKKHSA